MDELTEFSTETRSLNSVGEILRTKASLTSLKARHMSRKRVKGAKMRATVVDCQHGPSPEQPGRNVQVQDGSQ